MHSVSRSWCWRSLRGESVAGVQARGRTQDGPQGGVVSHQGHGPGPGRQGVEGLDQSHADHRPDGVAGSPGPAGGFQVGDQAPDLRGVQQGVDRLGVAV